MPKYKIIMQYPDGTNEEQDEVFDTEEGAQEYLTIMSYIGSARKHGINAFTAIREALNGNPDIIFS